MPRKLTIAFIVCLLLPNAHPTYAVEIFDPLDTIDGFTRNLRYTNPNIGTFSSTNGVLQLNHPPLDTYHQIFVEKTYPIDLSQTPWIHFRVKTTQYLMGQNMYNHFRFASSTNPSQYYDIIIGYNGEQHWLQAQPNACTPKTLDDEFFIAIDAAIVPDAWDYRLHYPTGYQKKYTDWIIFSLKYTPPNLSNTQGLISMYIDGHLVDNLTKIDNPTAPPINLNTDFFSTHPIDQVTIGPELFIDGIEYSYPGNKYGIRDRGCYARKSPALPGAITYPNKFTGNNGLAYKTDWMNHFDAIAALYLSELINYVPGIKPYQTPRSAINSTDHIPPSYPYHFYTNFSYLAQNQTFNTAVTTKIWNGIYAGTIDFETAVLTSVIPLPNANHTIWNYHPTGFRDELIAKLNVYNTNYISLSPPKRFFYDKVYSLGYVADLVHFGYITPEDARNTPSIWNYLSAADKAAIPQNSVPTDGQIQWDYIWITSQPPNAPTPTNDPAPPPPMGFDSDNDIDILDLLSFLSAFNTPSAPPYNLVSTDHINIFDLNAALTQL